MCAPSVARVNIGPSRGRHAVPLAGPTLWRRWTPGAARAVAIVLLAAVALVAWWWWQARPRPVDVIESSGPSAPQGESAGGDSSESTAPGSSASDGSVLITVHVIGRVRTPGIVELPEGARVADAIAAAGGLRDQRLRGDLNLARIVVDGEQIDVRRRSSNTDASPGTVPQAQGGTHGSGLIDLNRADAATLESLPGIGPVLAERIVAWRATNGRFPNVDVLGEVSGIGPTLMERLRPLVTV